MPYRTPPATPLGRAIQEAREAKQLTQDDLAKALESTQQSISRWESGRVTVPYDRLPDIAKVLDVDLQELITAATATARNHPRVDTSAPARIDTLEERIDEQDAKLSQILTLLEDLTGKSAKKPARRLAPVRAARAK